MSQVSKIKSNWSYIGRWGLILGQASFVIPPAPNFQISTPKSQSPNLAPNEVLVAQAATALPPEVRRGYTLLGQGLVRDAIASFEQAVRRYPTSLPAKLGLAIAYRRQGLIPQAWSTYQQVLAQDPNNRLALRSVGLLGSFRQEWQPRGIQALTTLLNLSPNDNEARAQRALLFGYQGRFPEALADYQIVLQANPTPDVIFGAAQIYTYSGNYQQGLELFRRYQATGRQITGNAAIAYARALRETGNPQAALQILTGLLRTSPTRIDSTSIQLRAELSQAYLANQQPAEALAVLDPLIGRADAMLPLARSLNEIRRRTNAPTLGPQVASLYRQVLATTPNPSVRLLREAADVLSGLPQEQQSALQIYRQLVAAQPNDKSLLLQQLVLENKLGFISQAELKQRLIPVLQFIPADRFQQRQFAQALVQIDNPDPDFLPVYQTLLDNGVNEPFLNFRIAQILIQRNDLQGARRALANYAASPAGARDQAPELVLAQIEAREGNLEGAARRYQALITSSSNDADVSNSALRGLAGIRQQQRRLDEALALYDQLIARNPQDLTTQLGRASIAYQAGRISRAEAEVALSRWLTTRPASDTPPELFGLVSALPAEQQREPLYNSLLEIDPTNVGVQLRLVQAIAQRNPAAARARVARLVARDPNNIGAYFLQGQLAQAIGDLEVADRAYQFILTQQPENIDALAALGGIRFQQRQFESAIQLYSQVLVFRPEDIGVRRALAGLSAALDRPIDAIEQLEAIQMQQMATGTPDNDSSRQRQQLQEDFLRRRGFQPPWERY